MAEPPPPPSVLQLDGIALPYDISFYIASKLSAKDLCSLGSSSRFWRSLSASDDIWMVLAKQRWPFKLEGPFSLEKKITLLTEKEEAECSSFPQSCFSTEQGWRSMYIHWHKVMAHGAATVIEFVKQHAQHDTLEAADYLKAVNDLRALGLGFIDVSLHLFSDDKSVLVNLIGLHYLLTSRLKIESGEILDALHSCRISDRKLCVRWWKLGRWVYGFRQRDEFRAHTMSLIDMLKPEKQEVLWVLDRGAVHEVLRVQISAELRSSP